MRAHRRPPAAPLFLLPLLLGCGASDSVTPEPEELPPPSYVSVAAGARHSCALDEEGRAYC